MHEDFSRDEEVETSSERSFGLVMAGFFAIVGLAPHLRGAGIRWWALGVAACFVVPALLRPALLAPLNRLWLRLALLLYKIVNPIVLGLLFFTTVTPVGWLMRKTGKDPLRLRRDTAAKSYWIVRAPPGPSPESMQNQF